MRNSIDTKSNIKSIVKAGQIIDLLAAAQSPKTLGDIAGALEIPKSTIHGLLSTLVNIGYLEQEQETGNYKLGVRLFELGSRISATWNEKAIARPYLVQLAHLSGETVHLAMFSDMKVLYVDKEEANSSIRIQTVPGASLPIHCTGVGKVLLAYQTQDEIDLFFKNFTLDKYSDYTIVDEVELRRELETIKRNGYGYDEQEFIDGLRCIAVPIFDNHKRVVFSMSISGPLSRMKDKQVLRYKEALLAACREISLKLGCRL